MKNEARSLTHRAISGMVWTAWGSGVMAVLKLVVLVLLTRLLSPSDFGVVGAALVILSFSLNFSQLGMGPALVQRPILQPRHISTAFVTSVVLGFVVGGLVWWSAPLIAQFFRMDRLVPVVRALAVLFPLAGVSTVPDNLLRRELRFRFLANRDIIAYAAGYGAVGVLLAFLGYGVWSLVAAQITHSVFRTLILLNAAPSMLGARPTWRSLMELMEYGVGQSIARFGVIAANQVDNLVVGRWLGAASLGLYSRAFQLISVPTALLGDVLDKVLFPTMSRVQDDPRRLASAYLRGVAFLALVTLPAGVVVAVLAADLVVVAFGQRWQPMTPALQLLALGMVFRTSSRMSDSLSRATGRVYRRAWRQVLYAGLVFLGAWIGHYWGVSGVAAGVLGAFFINYALMAQLSLNLAQISATEFVRAQFPAVRLTLLVGALTVLASTGARHFGLPASVSLIAGLAAAASSAGLAVWLAPNFALGEYGARMGDTLRSYLLPRISPARARGPV